MLQVMTVEVRHLRAFLAIAEEGTITGAAARLHLTQPALSRTLRQLETISASASSTGPPTTCG